MDGAYRIADSLIGTKIKFLIHIIPRYISIFCGKWQPFLQNPSNLWERLMFEKKKRKGAHSKWGRYVFNSTGYPIFLHINFVEWILFHIAIYWNQNRRRWWGDEDYLQFLLLNILSTISCKLSKEKELKISKKKQKQKSWMIEVNINSSQLWPVTTHASQNRENMNK